MGFRIRDYSMSPTQAFRAMGAMTIAQTMGVRANMVIYTQREPISAMDIYYAQHGTNPYRSPNPHTNYLGLNFQSPGFYEPNTMHVSFMPAGTSPSAAFRGLSSSGGFSLLGAITHVMQHGFGGNDRPGVDMSQLQSDPPAMPYRAQRNRMPGNDGP